jgi:hypothetical protein
LVGLYNNRGPGLQSLGLQQVMATVNGKFKINKTIRRGFEIESQSRRKTKKLTNLVTCACLNEVLIVIFHLHYWEHTFKKNSVTQC